jgi:hypothetical protein
MSGIRSEQIRDRNLKIIDLADFAVIATTGLGVTVQAGRIRNDSAVTDKSAQNLTLTNNTTNYIEIDNAGVASFNTSSFTTGNTPLATVATSDGALTLITDKRTWINIGTGGAVGPTGPQGPTGPTGPDGPSLGRLFTVMGA